MISSSYINLVELAIPAQIGVRGLPHRLRWRFSRRNQAASPLGYATALGSHVGIVIAVAAMRRSFQRQRRCWIEENGTSQTGRMTCGRAVMRLVRRERDMSIWKAGWRVALGTLVCILILILAAQIPNAAGGRRSYGLNCHE